MALAGVGSGGISSLTQTGCAAGEIMAIEVTRDNAGDNDTLGFIAGLHGLEVTINREEGQSGLGVGCR